MSLNKNSFLLLCAFAPSVTFAAPPKGPDLAATSEKIIGDVVMVKENEVVSIEADPADRAMAEELFISVGKRGGLPLMRVMWPGLDKKWLESVPAEKDGTRVTLEEKLVPLMDAIVTIERNDDPTMMKDLAPARVAAFSKAFSGLADKRMKRKTRSVNIGNGLAPGKANAKRLGVSEAELSSIFWAGLGTDYKALSARGEAVRAAVPAGKDIVITSPAGTNLKLKLAAKPMLISDGVISADEQKAGGPALLTWLPAGEAYGLIDPASAEGKIVMPRFTFQGEDVLDFTVMVKAGKVTEFTAKPSKAFDRAKQAYEAAAAGKEMLSILDFGLNADVKAPKGKQLLSFVPAGAVTLMLGGDLWAGGTNDSTFGIPLFLPDATVTADGKVVVEKGELKAPVVAAK